jgi:group I intron endonuclease
MLVYIVINKINNKKYIGYTTKTLHDRIKTHVLKAYSKSSKHYNYNFQRAIRKYSIDNFTWEVLCNCYSKKECIEKEIEYIKKYNSVSPNGYNLTYGGEGGLQSQETRKKISESIKKYNKLNPNRHNRMLNMSAETRKNVAQKAWITKRKNGYKAPLGFKMSDSSKQKMSFTKNKKNKCNWINILSGEIVCKSLTDMSKYTGLSIGVFNHLKQGRQQKTKCGWRLYIK